MTSVSQRTDFIRRSVSSGHWLRGVLVLRSRLCAQPWRPPSPTAVAPVEPLPSALDLLLKARAARGVAVDRPPAAASASAAVPTTEPTLATSSSPSHYCNANDFAQPDAEGGLAAAVRVGFGLDSIDCLSIKCSSLLEANTDSSSTLRVPSNASSSLQRRRPATEAEAKEAAVLLVDGCKALLPELMRMATSGDAVSSFAKGIASQSPAAADAKEEEVFSPLAALYLLDAARRHGCLQSLPMALLRESLLDFVLPLLRGGHVSDAHCRAIAEGLVYPLFSALVASGAPSARQKSVSVGPALRLTRANVGPLFALDVCGDIVDAAQFDVFAEAASAIIAPSQQANDNGMMTALPLSPKEHEMLFAFSLGPVAFATLFLRKEGNSKCDDVWASEAFATSPQVVAMAARSGTLAAFLSVSAEAGGDTFRSAVAKTVMGLIAGHGASHKPAVEAECCDRTAASVEVPNIAYAPEGGRPRVRIGDRLAALKGVLDAAALCLAWGGGPTAHSSSALESLRVLESAADAAVELAITESTCDDNTCDEEDATRATVPAAALVGIAEAVVRCRAAAIRHTLAHCSAEEAAAVYEFGACCALATSIPEATERVVHSAFGGSEGGEGRLAGWRSELRRVIVTASLFAANSAALSAGALKMLLDAPVNGLPMLQLKELSSSTGLPFGEIFVAPPQSNSAPLTSLPEALPNPAELSGEELIVRAIFGPLAAGVALYAVTPAPQQQQQQQPANTYEEVVSRIVNAHSDDEVLAHNSNVWAELLRRLPTSTDNCGAMGACDKDMPFSSPHNKLPPAEALLFLLRMLRPSSTLNQRAAREHAVRSAAAHGGVACAALVLPSPAEPLAWRAAEQCFTLLTARGEANNPAAEEANDGTCTKGSGGYSSQLTVLPNDSVEAAFHGMTVLSLGLHSRDANATGIARAVARVEGIVTQCLSLQGGASDAVGLSLLLRSCCEVLSAFYSRSRENSSDAATIAALRQFIAIVVAVAKAAETQCGPNSGAVFSAAPNSGAEGMLTSTRSVAARLEDTVSLLRRVRLAYDL